MKQQIISCEQESKPQVLQDSGFTYVVFQFENSNVFYFPAHQLRVDKHHVIRWWKHTDYMLKLKFIETLIHNKLTIVSFFWLIDLACNILNIIVVFQNPSCASQLFNIVVGNPRHFSIFMSNTVILQLFFPLFFFGWQESFKRDLVTGLDTVLYDVRSTQELDIDGAPCTVIHVVLTCDVNITPWCDPPPDPAARPVPKKGRWPTVTNLRTFNTAEGQGEGLGGGECRACSKHRKISCLW